MAASRRKKATPEEVSRVAESLSGALKNYKASWATLKQLGYADEKLAPEAARTLVKGGRWIVVGKLKGAFAFAITRHANPKETLVALAELAIAERGRGDRLVLLPVAKSNDVYKGLPGKVRDQIGSAVKRLVERRDAFTVKVGKNNQFVLASNLEGLLQARIPAAPVLREVSTRAEVPAALSAGPIDKARVVEAYARLTRDRHSPNVVVADLQREAGVPLEPLKEWLLAECLAHRAIPLLGEPARATEEQLAAALFVEGERHLYVRLLEGGQS